MTLKGSEKQVKWAEDIRNDFIINAEEMIALQKERATTGDTDRYKLEAMIRLTGIWNDYKSKLKEVQEEILMPSKSEEGYAEAKKAIQMKRADVVMGWMEEAVKEKLEEENASVWIENRPR